MTARPHVRAVIVNFNGGPLLERCVDALAASDGLARIDIVIVDNASTDDSLGAVAKRPEVTVIALPTNGGFGANNRAIEDLISDCPPPGRLTRPDVVALINPDAAPAPDALARLASQLSATSRIGAAAPRIVFDQPFVELDVRGRVEVESAILDGDDVSSRVHGAGDTIRLPGDHGPIWIFDGAGTLAVPVTPGSQRLELVVDGGGVVAGERVERHGTIQVDVARYEASPRIQNAGSALDGRGWGHNLAFHTPVDDAMSGPSVPLWCGAAVALHPDMIRAVGGFHEPYFLYYEDIDLALRGLAAGWRTVHVEDAVVQHRHSDRSVQGTALVERHQHRNRLVMLARNAPTGVALGELVRAALTPASIVVSAVGDSRHRAARIRLAKWRLASVARAVPLVVRAIIEGRRTDLADRELTRAQTFAAAQRPEPATADR